MKTLRERGIRNGLTKRIKRLLEEMRSMMRIKKEMGESFWMVREVRLSAKPIAIQYTTGGLRGLRGGNDKVGRSEAKGRESIPCIS